MEKPRNRSGVFHAHITNAAIRVTPTVPAERAGSGGLMTGRAQRAEARAQPLPEVVQRGGDRIGAHLACLTLELVKIFEVELGSEGAIGHGHGPFHL